MSDLELTGSLSPPSSSSDLVHKTNEALKTSEHHNTSIDTSQLQAEAIQPARLTLADAWARDASLRPFLEAYFSKDPTPSAAVVDLLATQCNATVDSVSAWFAAKRQREEQLLKQQIQLGASQSSKNPSAETMQSCKPTPPHVEQLKFPVMSLHIGSWSINSQFRGDLCGEFDLLNKIFVWERLDRGVRQRLVIPFRCLAGVELSATSETTARIGLAFSSAVQFLEEANPRPLRPGVTRSWINVPDFTTDAQGTKARRHLLICNKVDVEHHLRRLIAFEPSIKTLISRGIKSRV